MEMVIPAVKTESVGAKLTERLLNLISETCNEFLRWQHVAGELRQLEESWEMIHNPMSDAEAEAILQKAFPDESGVGSAA